MTSSKTEILRQLGTVYFTAVEKLSTFINRPNSVRAAEVLFFIHNQNTYRRFPAKSYIQLHLYIKDIAMSLKQLRDLNLIELIDDKHYRCTETFPSLERESDLFEYYVALHALDDFYSDKINFNKFISFVHAIESLPGLETPISSRRTLVRCFCMCDKYTYASFSGRVSKSTACMYARDIRQNYDRFDYAINEDTYDELIKKTDRYNAVKYHQLFLLRNSQAYLNGTRDTIIEEVKDIVEKAKSMQNRYTKETICQFLYEQIVTKKLQELELERQREVIYWSEQPSLECIEGDF